VIEMKERMKGTRRKRTRRNEGWLMRIERWQGHRPFICFSSTFDGASKAGGVPTAVLYLLLQGWGEAKEPKPYFYRYPPHVPWHGNLKLNGQT